MEKEGLPARARFVLTVLHSGGKFGDGGGYKVSGGLHGRRRLRSSTRCRSASKSRFAATGTSTGRSNSPAGAPQTELIEVEELAPGRRPTGTNGHVSCPTPTSFETLDLDHPHARGAPARDGVLDPAALKISIVDEARRGSTRRRSATRAGIEDFVAYLNENKETVHRKVIFFAGEFRRGRRRGRDAVELLPTRSRFTHSPTTSTRVRVGSHMSGFRSALTRTPEQVRARDHGLLKEKEGNLSGEGRPRGA